MNNKNLKKIILNSKVRLDEYANEYAKHKAAEVLSMNSSHKDLFFFFLVFLASLRICFARRQDWLTKCKCTISTNETDKQV